MATRFDSPRRQPKGDKRERTRAKLLEAARSLIRVASSEAMTGFREVATTDFPIGKDNNGVAAAEIAALVPNLRASRRVILLVIRFLLCRLKEQYHRQLLGEQDLLGHLDGDLAFRSVQTGCGKLNEALGGSSANLPQPRTQLKDLARCQCNH